MTPAEREADLLQALRGGESDRVERKPSLSQSKEIRQAICAFANDLPDSQKPGYVIVGQEDDGSASRLTIDDEVLRKLSDIRGEGWIQPFPVIRVMKQKVEGGDLAVIVVEPATAPPVRYRGTVWVRIGAATHRAGPEEERRLNEKRRARDVGFELWPVPTATLDDLRSDAIETYLQSAIAPEVLEQNERSREQQLTSLRLLTVGDEPQPTAHGLLVAGKDPRAFLPGAYVQFLRIAGTELGDPIASQKALDGALVDLLTQMDLIFDANIQVATDITSGPREIRHPDYPLEALQQLARNAVLHRTYEVTNAPVRITWYKDRVEIQNPGGPYGQVNRFNFGEPGVADYRNPYLAGAMKYLGFVQRFGVGIATARRELALNGNPPPEFNIQPEYISVVVRKAG